MKVVVDAEVCVGCELCVQMCQEVFKMQDNKAVAFIDEVPGRLFDKCKEAAEGCPVNAITIEM
jgi:ferredoxin